MDRHDLRRGSAPHAGLLPGDYKEGIVKLKITKPVAGTVDIVIDDLRGSTGRRTSARSVKLADAGQRVGELVGEWAQKKQAVRAARS